jgi:hypothetical protein
MAGREAFHLLTFKIAIAKQYFRPPCDVGLSGVDAPSGQCPRYFRYDFFPTL